MFEMESGAGLLNGTRTLMTSAVCDSTIGLLPPPKVTVVVAALNFSVDVELIVSVSPPFGVVLDRTPPNACGRTATRTVSTTPLPLTTTHDGAALTAVTMTRAEVAGTGW